MKQAWETIVAFKLVWFRVCCYFLLPFMISLLDQFKDWDGDAWDFAHWFVITKCFMFATIFGLSNLVAFIDQSLSRAREVVEHKRENKSGTGNAQ